MATVCVQPQSDQSSTNGSFGDEVLGPTAVFSPQEDRPALVDNHVSLSMSSKLLRSLSSKLRSRRQRANVEPDMGEIEATNRHGSETQPATDDPHEFPDDARMIYGRWHMMGCFGLHGKFVRQTSVGKGDATYDGILAEANESHHTMGAPFARDCNDVKEAVVELSLHEIAGASNLSRDERPSGRQQCGCFANGGSCTTVHRVKISEGWLKDGDTCSRTDENDAGEYNWYEGQRRPLSKGADYLEKIGFNLERSREPLQEIVRANLGSLEPSQLNEERPSGRQQCGCFANSSIDRFKKDWGSKKGEKVGGRESLQTGEVDVKPSSKEQGHPGLPDDVVEMCLARTSFSTLARARVVCRKWRALTMSPHFLASREKLLSRKPWLLLFGLSRDGVSTGEIHALDTSLDQWHSIRADVLSGRFLFSVASLKGLVFVLGGCSSLPNGNDKPEKSTMKTHKGVLVYNPFTCSWTKGCSMGFARAMAVAAVFEMRDGQIVRETSSSRSFESCQCEGLEDKIEANLKGSSKFGCDGRGWCNLGSFEEISGNNRDDQGWQEAWDPVLFHHNHSFIETTKPKNAGETCHGWERSEKHMKSYGLIVVGGQGLWSQPLFSAEIYDPSTNTWREIAKLPADHGVTCAGVVCNGLFYAYSETDKLAAYDFELNVWITIQVSNTLTRLHEYIPKLVSCKGKIILLGVAWGSHGRETCNITSRAGGNNADAATRVLWEFNPSSRTWHQISKHPDAPLDWNAVSISEGDHIYGVEMFKIFGQVLDFVTLCDLSGSEATWKRMSRMRLGNDLDVSSCISKTAVVVQL